MKVYNTSLFCPAKAITNGTNYVLLTAILKKNKIYENNKNECRPIARQG